MTALGRPVSHALTIPHGLLAPAMREVLRAIDAVHGDGILPLVPVTWTASLPADGFYRFDDRTGTPTRIILNSASKVPRLVLLHEIGHFLDHQGIGKPGRFESPRSRLLRAWRGAISESEAYLRLRATRIAAVRSARTSLDPALPIEAEFLWYLLAYPELWARSYAQFVAYRSGHGALLADLESRRRSSGAAVAYHMLWADDDFAPIATEMERLFRGLAWLA